MTAAEWAAVSSHPCLACHRKNEPTEISPPSSLIPKTCYDLFYPNVLLKSNHNNQSTQNPGISPVKKKRVQVIGWLVRLGAGCWFCWRGEGVGRGGGGRCRTEKTERGMISRDYSFPYFFLPPFFSPSFLLPAKRPERGGGHEEQFSPSDDVFEERHVARHGPQHRQHVPGHRVAGYRVGKREGRDHTSYVIRPRKLCTIMARRETVPELQTSLENNAPGSHLFHISDRSSIPIWWSRSFRTDKYVYIYISLICMI